MAPRHAVPSPWASFRELSRMMSRGSWVVPAALGPASMVYVTVCPHLLRRAAALLRLPARPRPGPSQGNRFRVRSHPPPGGADRVEEEAAAPRGVEELRAHGRLAGVHAGDVQRQPAHHCEAVGAVAFAVARPKRPADIGAPRRWWRVTTPRRFGDGPLAGLARKGLLWITAALVVAGAISWWTRTQTCQDRSRDQAREARATDARAPAVLALRWSRSATRRGRAA